MDVENGGEIVNVQVVPNPGYSQPRGGAGVTAAQFVIDQGADVVISTSLAPTPLEFSRPPA
ncbi:hypothetical protein [Thermococcus peptonophilus]|uniref:hypothetical protein n=1 Tax=Thermococcus peptonophilus TaxID=53952 RepID=UPI000AF5CFAC